MNPARESLWNIPEWGHLFMYFSQALAVAILMAKLYLRGRVWRQGQGQLQFDHFWQRIVRVLKYGVAQLRITRDKFAGAMHLSLFWAFVFLFIGTTLAFIDYDIGELLLGIKNPILKGPFYLIFEVVLDAFTIIGIVGLTMALIRRLGPRPSKLTYDSGFTFMLGLFWVLFVNGLLIEAIRLTVAEPAWGGWSFAGYGVSRMLLATGISFETLRIWHIGLWVFHVFTVFVFWVAFVDMPTRHILFSPLNVFFSSFEPAGVLHPLDLENDDIDVFGVNQIHEFNMFQLLNGDACTECGRCQAACPAYMAGTPLNPKQIILDIRAGMDKYSSDLLQPGDPADKELPVVREIISTDALWACTTCRACVYECPVLIEHVDSIVDMRRYLTLMEGDVPDLLGNAMTQAERAGDPWGNPRGSRLDWAEGLDVPIMENKKKADVLYWIGCAGAYDPESQKTSKAMIRIFKAAGIDYAILGNEERCNCEWARRAGNEYLFQEATHSNIAIFDKYEFDVIVTHCPHCFNTFANEYPQFGGNYDVVHHSTYIAELISKGFLKIDQKTSQQITFHDSCYLGRYNDVYESPREVLQSTGLNLVEMERSKSSGLCCGGGGAQVWMETHQENPVNEIRLDEAMATGSEQIGTACPFCTIMLTSAAQTKGVTEEVAVRDIALIVAEAI